MSLNANVVNSTMGCRADGWNEHLEMSSCYSDTSPLTQPRQSRMSIPSLHVERALNGNASTSPLVLKQEVYLSETHLLNFFKIPTGFTLTCKEIHLLCFQAHKYLTALWKALSSSIIYSSKNICENKGLQAVPMIQSTVTRFVPT